MLFFIAWNQKERLQYCICNIKITKNTKNFNKNSLSGQQDVGHFLNKTKCFVIS